VKGFSSGMYPASQIKAMFENTRQQSYVMNENDLRFYLS